MDWAKAGEDRNQMVLFAEKLDDAIAPDHCVRVLWGILQRLDWSRWEAKYKLTRGMPPIHPSILAGVVLYGLLKRIRTSRGLEEALQVRIDFRWLAEGRSIDHTTLSKFRQSNSEALGELFVQIGLVAQQMGHLTLVTLGYDGTRIRSNNRNSGTRTAAQLRQAKQQLAEQFQQHQAACRQAQTHEDEVFDSASDDEPKDPTLQRQMEQVDNALAEIARLEEEGKKVPDRLPITDPHSRVAKNKQGGFDPNYNPTVTVDVDSGLIVDGDVIRGTDEQSHMIEAVARARKNFAAEGDRRDVEVLADGLMATGRNVSQCPAEQIEFYSPAGPENPAYREDPSEPLSAEKIDQLPLRGKKPKRGEQDRRTFDKSAFLYDHQKDVYVCPMGKVLERRSRRKDHRGDERFLYRAARKDCAACPLQKRCFTNGRKQYGRRIECGVHEVALQAHASKMQTTEARAKYSRRAAATERPFAVIKQFFGARSFLTRGIDRVRNEWRWLTIACNLHRLLHLADVRSGSP